MGNHLGGMTDGEIDGTLAFLGMAERLKDTPRIGHTTARSRESTSEHTWWLCLMALVQGESLGGVDTGRLLRICLLHGLAEALAGNIPAPTARGDKSAAERAALATLTAPLPKAARTAIVALWEEYETGRTAEGRIAKGLDKLETILQHTEGANPPRFDIAYNLDYGRGATDADPLLAAIRTKLDARSRARLDAAAVSLPGTT